MRVREVWGFSVWTPEIEVAGLLGLRAASLGTAPTDKQLENTYSKIV